MSQKKDKAKILFFRESVFRVATLLFNYPNQTFHIRSLEKKIGFSTTAVISAVKELRDFQIVTVEETEITTNIRANLERQEYKFYKLIFNLYRLRRYGLVDNLADFFRNPEAIVMYGSFSRGEDVEKSDVDMLVITPLGLSAIEAITKSESFLKWVKIFEEEFNRKLDLKVLASLEKSSTDFKNSIANGIVLSGYVRVL